MEENYKALDLLGFKTFIKEDAEFFFDQKGNMIPMEEFNPEDYFSRMVDAINSKQLEDFDKAITDDGRVERYLDETRSLGELLGFMYDNKKKFTEILLNSL